MAKVVSHGTVNCRARIGLTVVEGTFDSGPVLGCVLDCWRRLSETEEAVTVHSPSRASRVACKIGYLVAVMVNVIMLILVNAIPGWRVLPFLTEDFVSLLWLVNLSMFASAMVNVAYLAYDAAWFKSACQIVVTAIGLVAAIRTWQVFPFDFSPYAGLWETLTRLLLVLAIFGSIVAILVELVRFTSRGISAGVRSQTH